MASSFAAAAGSAGTGADDACSGVDEQEMQSAEMSTRSHPFMRKEYQSARSAFCQITEIKVIG